jgi:hypothetical protein
MSRISATSSVAKLWSNAATNRLPTRPVPPIYRSVPSRAPGMRGKEEVERLARLEAQYNGVRQRLDIKI